MRIPQHSYLVDLVGWAPPDPEARYRPTWRNWVTFSVLAGAATFIAVAALASGGWPR